MIQIFRKYWSTDVLGAHDNFLRKRRGGGGGGTAPGNDLDTVHRVTAGQRWRRVVQGRGGETLPGGPRQAPCS
jgi:hypothetical protein